MDKTSSATNVSKGKSNSKIEKLIYTIRGQQVMLDSDLAKLYQCKNGTKTINQAVRRNRDRFPEDFCFQLSKADFEYLKSQVGTSRLGSKHGGVRKMPVVFTEQGVAMLSSVLRTEVAVEASINIMRAFVLLKKYAPNNFIEQKYYNAMVVRHENEIELLKESFGRFSKEGREQEIYFNGQIFDAYYKILEIFKEAKESLTIIDNYSDSTTLDIIKRIKTPVTIITSKYGPLTKQDINKYNKQYNNLIVVYNETFHDRYFILDEKTVYHCGASINRVGYKTFSVTRINDKSVISMIINEGKKIIRSRTTK